MLTFEQIKELIDLVRERQLQGVEIERSGFRLKIDGRPAEAVTVIAGDAKSDTRSAAGQVSTAIAAGSESATPTVAEAQAAAEAELAGGSCPAVPDRRHVLHRSQSRCRALRQGR